jgi:hypothetical protein
MPSPSRYYSSTSAKTTLSSAVDSLTASLQLAAASGFPGQYPYTLILEKDTANEEIVQVNSLVGTSYGVTRGVDGSTAKAHSVGATVEHGVSARDFTDSRAHEVLTSAHGVTGDIVGTGGTQTLTGKTLTTATLGSILDAGGYKITNLATPTASSDAVRKDFADAQVTAAGSSATAAATSASSALASQQAAATSAASASTSASSALASQQAASTSAASALVSQTAANTSAASALASQTAAATSAASALASQNAASTSAASALTSQTAANSSAIAAASSATTATASVASIAGYASAAATSASSSLTSANSAAASALAASTSAASASTSASSANTTYNSIVNLTGAGILRDLGTITDTDTTTTTYLNVATLTASALASQTAAATSAASALTSQTAAATSATSAANSATAAATSATSAAASATAAATSATSAANSATQAAVVVASAIQGTLINAKGDLLVGQADDVANRLPVGTDGYLLTAASTATYGVQWAAAPISLPSQGGNGGKYLTTNGSTASWASIVTDPLPQIFLLMGA